MKYGYTIIYVNSVEDTPDFYKQAFGFDTKFLHESKGYGELQTGETTIAFASHQMGEMNFGDSYTKATSSHSFRVELAFVTENVHQAFEKALSAGAVSVQQPKEKPWGQVVGYVRAIDGSLIELCTPVSG